MHILPIFAFIIFQFNIVADTFRIEGIVIVDADPEELRQLSLDLLLEKKEELAREGNWSEQDLINFTKQINAKSYGQTKEYVEKNLKRIKVNTLFAKEDRLTKYLEQPGFTHYLKFNFDLEVSKGSILLITRYDLFDQTGKRIEIDDDKNFFREIKKINKRAPTTKYGKGEPFE